jgi:hypothetical protein
MALFLALGLLAATGMPLSEAHQVPPDDIYLNAAQEVRQHLSLAAANLTLDTSTALSHLSSAWVAYNDTLGSEGGLLAPETDARIQGAFDGAQDAILASDGVLLSIHSQFIKKGVLDLAWRSMWHFLTTVQDPTLPMPGTSSWRTSSGGVTRTPRPRPWPPS